MARVGEWMSVLFCQVFQVSFHTEMLVLSINDRDAGVKAIENLLKKKGKFDYILLETTGLADPGISCVGMLFQIL
jgi:CobW/HypB/UreG, nucleotide-binding domain